jgi:hypothetical protein
MIANLSGACSVIERPLISVAPSLGITAFFPRRPSSASRLQTEREFRAQKMVCVSVLVD